MKKKSSYKSPSKKLSVALQRNEYDKDFFKWTKCQANLLKKGNLENLDIENLIEEIESLGTSQRKAIKSYCIVLLTHLLKQKYQPENDCNSWRSSIANAIREIKLLFEYSPSLKSELKKVFDDSYQDAREDASIETNLDIKTFPEQCPWKIEDLFPYLNKK